MTQWLTIIFLIVLFLILELVLYILYLLIKTLRIYIRKNTHDDDSNVDTAGKKLKAGLISILSANILIVIIIITISFAERNSTIYNTENVIICNSTYDVEKLIDLLDETGLSYKVLNNTKVKLQNKEDFETAKNIVIENQISYSTINIER